MLRNLRAALLLEHPSLKSRSIGETYLPTTGQTIQPFPWLDRVLSPGLGQPPAAYSFGYFPA